MQEVRTRALRRHHSKRIKDYCRANHYWTGGDVKRVGKAATTPKVCSCFMCGNPRRHFGWRSFSEIRMFQEGLFDDERNDHEA